MEFAIWVIVIGLALIDGHIWKMVREQTRHNKATEAILAEIRNSLGAARLPGL